jgi:hypothetical protein
MLVMNWWYPGSLLRTRYKLAMYFTNLCGYCPGEVEVARIVVVELGPRLVRVNIFNSVSPVKGMLTPLAAASRI